MRKDRKRKPTEGGYQYVTDLKRRQLIELVYNDDGMTLKQAAKQLGIKYSTAKTIKRVFEIEKRVTKLPNPRRSKVKRRHLLKNKQQIFVVAHLNERMKVAEKPNKKFKKLRFKQKKLDSEITKPFEKPTTELHEKTENAEKLPEFRSDLVFQFLELMDERRRLQTNIITNKFYMDNISLYSKFYDPSSEMIREMEAIAKQTENLMNDLASVERKRLLFSN